MHVNEEGIDCCGIAELTGFISEGSVKLHLLSAWSTFYERERYDFDSKRMVNAMVPYCAFLFFSDVSPAAKATEMASFIKKNKFGLLKYVGEKLNPNSSHLLKMWVWAPNDTFKKWGQNETSKSSY